MFICIKVDLVLITYNGWCSKKNKTNKKNLIKSIRAKVNLTEQLEFQLAYNDAAVFHISQSLQDFFMGTLVLVRVLNRRF